jgi:HSP20 family protein
MEEKAMKRATKRIFLCVLTAALLLVTPIASFSEESVSELRQQIEGLKKRVAELEKQITDSESQSPGHDQSPLLRRGWDPFAEMEEMQKQMNRMFQDSFSRGVGTSRDDYPERGFLFDPQVDISETATKYIFKMDIPGMEKDQINVEVKNGALLISGKRSNEAQETGPNNFTRRERSFGAFSRSLPLPEDAKSEEITAEYKDGVLAIMVGRIQAGAKKTVPTKKITVQ